MGACSLYFLLSGLTFLVAFLFVLDVVFGSVSIPFQNIVHILLGIGEEKESWKVIIFHLRLPRAITAVFVGAGLSVSGLLLQTFFRNPLAGPYVLGISAGSSLGVATYVAIHTGIIAVGISFPISDGMGNWGEFFAACIGATLILMILLIISLRIPDSVVLLILGLLIGQAASALITIIQYYGTAESIRTYVIWTFGSFSGVSWNKLRIMVPIITITVIGSFFYQKAFDALLLGEVHAHNLGISVFRTRLVLILQTSLITGVITSFCGPIAFVGMAVPHLARSLIPTSNHGFLLPTVVLCGAAISLSCDIISQVPGKSGALPINAITALFGAPIVIGFILKNRRISAFFR